MENARSDYAAGVFCSFHYPVYFHSFAVTSRKYRSTFRSSATSVMPFFRTAFTGAMSLGWKAGIAAEVLTVPKQSVGRMISESKLYLMTEDLFAWTLTVVVLSLLLQKIMLQLLKGRDGHA